MKLCINCYTENPLDEVFCSECGMSLRRAATGEAAIKLKAQIEGHAPAREEPGPQPELAPGGETATGQSRLAYRLAAGVLFVGVLLHIVDFLVSGGAALGVAISAVAIDLILAIGLLRLSSRARFWVLVRAALGGIGLPILFFLGTEPFAAMVMSAIQWGYSGALVLLLTGQSKTWRLGLASAIFVGFTLGPVVLGLLTAALVWLVRM